MKVKRMNALAHFILACFIATWVPGCDQEETVEKRKEQTVRQLRLGMNIGPGSALHLAAEKFADAVWRKSGERVRISIHPNQELGDDHQMVEMARNGRLDIALTPTAKLSTLIPAMQFPDLPFLFPTPEDAYEILDGETGKMLLDRMKPYGLIGAAIWENGFKHFTANRPIRRPEDFQGLNIRIMKSRIISEQFRALGANPVPIDFHATHQALKDGVADGQENPLVAIAKMKFYEVQPHLTVSNHAYLPYILYFSKSVYDTLPPDIQAILSDTARELTAFEREETKKREKGFLEIIRTAGTEIHYLTETERRAFQEATAHIIEEQKSEIGADIVEKAQAYLREKYHMPEKDDVLIGLNADMSLGGALAGKAIKRGMELAVAEINARGGLLGKPVRIVAMDCSGIAARGIANMQKFITFKNLLAVMGGMHTSMILANLETVHQEKIVYLIPWASTPSIIHHSHSPSFVFRISACNSLSGPFLAEYAMKQSDRIAFLMGNTECGRSNLAAMSSTLEQAGIKAVSTENFNWGGADMTPQLTRIEKSGAEVILTAVNAPEGIGLIRSMSLRPRKIPIVSHWGISGGNFFEPVKKELETISFQFIQTFSFLKPGTPAAQKLMRAYLKKYGLAGPEKIPAPIGTAHAYDLVHLLAAAVKNAGTLDRAKVRDAMEKIEIHEGAVKTYAPPFTADNHDALDERDFFMAVYDREGCIRPVEPNEDLRGLD